MLLTGWGSGPVLPGQEKDLRVVKLPDGACTLLEEAGPNPTDDNSAAMVMYQVITQLHWTMVSRSSVGLAGACSLA